MDRASNNRLGLIVNPIAGMGGVVGLHGTDAGAWMHADALGAEPVAGIRAARALQHLIDLSTDIEVWAAGGSMGEDVARSVGFDPRVIAVSPHPTTAADTRAAAERMRDEGVDLILFAGGDGTARDITATVGTEVAVLGIPTGVKMHSAVFGTSPEAAGDLAARHLVGAIRTRERDVLDADADGVRTFMVARVPHAEGLLQRAKASTSLAGDAGVIALGRAIADEMEPGRLYLIGPGTTVGAVLDALGLEATHRGVDVVLDGTLLCADASEHQLHEVLDSGRPATLVLGVIGGQGFLLGRGNQQISPAIVSRVGEENVVIMASHDKVAGLVPPVLHVDTGTAVSEPVMLGYRRVRVTPSRSIVMRVVDGSQLD